MAINLPKNGDSIKEYDTLQTAEIQDVTAQLAQTVKQTDKIKSDQLSTNVDYEKIKLINLADEVQQAITGNAPALSIIEDKSVGLEKLGFVDIIHTNLANPSDFESGMAVVYNTGRLYPISNLKATGWIEVLTGEQYSVSGKRSMAFYDASKTFISGFAEYTWENPITIPENAYYLRATFNESDEQCTVVKGNTLPETFIPYSEFTTKITSEELKSELKELSKTYTEYFKKNSMDIDVLKPFKIESVNLVNEVANDSGVNPANGTIYGASGFIATDFIEIDANETYAASQHYALAFYDNEKTFIEGKKASTWNNPLQPPENAKYVRLSFRSDHTTPMFVQDESIPSERIPYEPVIRFTTEDWKKQFINALNIETPNNRLNGLKWNVLGDSITEGPNYLGFTSYPYYIAERTGVIVNNYGISGSTICEMDDSDIVKNGTRTAESFNPMCVRYVDMGDADVITVMGGTNDVEYGAILGAFEDRTAKTFYGALHVLLIGLLTKYPDKAIGYIIAPEDEPSASGRKADFYNAILEVCHYYAVPVCDLNYSSGLSGRVSARKMALIPDGIHPSDRGQELISHRIEKFLETL